MTQKHTPGPWRITRGLSEGYIAQDIGGYVPIRTPFREDAFKDGPSRSDHTEEEVAANAARIVACVNACEDINPEAVPEIVKALDRVEARLTHVARAFYEGGTSATLRAAFHDWQDDINPARAALAKARGEA